MKSWVSITILAIILMNVGTFGHEFMEDADSKFSHSFSQSEQPTSEGEGRVAGLQKQDISDKNHQSNEGASSSYHSCHVGHCSFVLPFHSLAEPQLNSLVYIPFNKNFSPVDLLHKRKPPKV